MNTNMTGRSTLQDQWESC